MTKHKVASLLLRVTAIVIEIGASEKRCYAIKICVRLQISALDTFITIHGNFHELISKASVFRWHYPVKEGGEVEDPPHELRRKPFNGLHRYNYQHSSDYHKGQSQNYNRAAAVLKLEKNI